MLVIAAPARSLIRVMWYSDGPGYAWNSHPKSGPQNWRAFSVSSAGISMCTISPGIRPPLVVVRRRRSLRHGPCLRPVGRNVFIGDVSTGTIGAKIVETQRGEDMTASAQTQHLPSLGSERRAEVGRELQATLVELVDLSLVGKQLHWNVVGPLFRP